MRVAATFQYEPYTWSKKWKEYYTRFFDEVIFFNYEKEFVNIWAEAERRLNDHVKRLLKDFDLVCFVDLDEFLVADPDRYKDLGDYLDRFDKKYTRAHGYNIIQMPNEKPLDLKKKILPQREYWQHDKLYDICVLTKVPVHFRTRHRVSPYIDIDYDLKLLHLRDADTQRVIESSKKLNIPYRLDHLKERRQEVVKIPEKWKLL